MGTYEDIQDRLPQSRNASVLITAQTVGSPVPQNIETLEIKPFPESKALAFFLQCLGITHPTPQDDDAAKQLSRQIGGNPLILYVVTRELKSRDITLGDILGRLSTEGLEVAANIAETRKLERLLAPTLKSLSITPEPLQVLGILSVMSPGVKISTGLFHPRNPILPAELEELQFLTDNEL